MAIRNERNEAKASVETSENMLLRR
jgi:hypothetical protein